MDLIDVRREMMGVIARMAGSQNYLSGSITLDQEQRYIEISVPFAPKTICIVLRELPQGTINYKAVIGIGAFYDNPVNASISSVWDGYTWIVCESNETTSRTLNPVGFAYENGILTLPARSSANSWSTGIYDYVIAG